MITGFVTVSYPPNDNAHANTSTNANTKSNSSGIPRNTFSYLHVQEADREHVLKAFLPPAIRNLSPRLEQCAVLAAKVGAPPVMDEDENWDTNEDEDGDGDETEKEEQGGEGEGVQGTEMPAVLHCHMLDPTQAKAAQEQRCQHRQQRKSCLSPVYDADRDNQRSLSRASSVASALSFKTTSSHAITITPTPTTPPYTRFIGDFPPPDMAIPSYPPRTLYLNRTHQIPSWPNPYLGYRCAWYSYKKLDNPECPGVWTVCDALVKGASAKRMGRHLRQEHGMRGAEDVKEQVKEKKGKKTGGKGAGSKGGRTLNANAQADMVECCHVIGFENRLCGARVHISKLAIHVCDEHWMSRRVRCPFCGMFQVSSRYTSQEHWPSHCPSYWEATQKERDSWKKYWQWSKKNWREAFENAEREKREKADTSEDDVSLGPVQHMRQYDDQQAIFTLPTLEHLSQGSTSQSVPSHKDMIYMI
ncbi:hypothetical protein AX17_001581 [Amanita inopinata Kibby_2008]|nr:hypothetical protein AX17_001581 [Amanita inopinata Kibby_2008]